MRRICHIFIMIVLFVIMGVGGYQPILANAQQVVVINIKGEIDGGQAALVNRAVADAEKKQARAIMIEIDTFGGLVDSASLGVYLIASLIAGVVYMMAQNLASNVFLPGLSAATRNGSGELQRAYFRLQLVADAIIVTLAGALISAGSTIVQLLFDQQAAIRFCLRKYDLGR